MNVFKQIFRCSLIVLISILFGLLYVKILLESNSISKEGLGFLLHVFFTWGRISLGLIIGLVISIVYILCDVLISRYKQRDKEGLFIIRVGLFSLVAFFVIAVHYFLEKVINII